VNVLIGRVAELKKSWTVTKEGESISLPLCLEILSGTQHINFNLRGQIWLKMCRMREKFCKKVEQGKIEGRDENQ